MTVWKIQQCLTSDNVWWPDEGPRHAENAAAKAAVPHTIHITLSASRNAYDRSIYTNLTNVRKTWLPHSIATYTGQRDNNISSIQGWYSMETTGSPKLYTDRQTDRRTQKNTETNKVTDKLTHRKTILSATHGWYLGPTVFHGRFCQIPRASLQKFCDLSRQNRPNSTAHCTGLPFVSKLSSVLLKNFSFWRAGWHSDIVLSYASNVQRKLSIFFILKVQSVRLCCIYLWWWDSY